MIKYIYAYYHVSNVMYIYVFQFNYEILDFNDIKKLVYTELDIIGHYSGYFMRSFNLFATGK